MTHVTYVFGANAVLGWHIVQQAQNGNLVPCCSAHARLPPAYAHWTRMNLDDGDAVREVFRQRPPDRVIHCGAVCSVGKCERDPDFARRVNLTSIEHLLGALPKTARLIYCSSDHVFGAGGGEPCDETQEPAPISCYGRLRVAAEQLILRQWENALVLRCSLTIGPSLDGRQGHLDWLRYRASHRLPMTIVRDEARSATWATDLAHRVVALAASAHRGLRHLPATQSVSRIDLAHYLNDRFAIGAAFKLATRAEQPTPHLGQIVLATTYPDPLAQPLPSVLP